MCKAKPERKVRVFYHHRGSHQTFHFCKSLTCCIVFMTYVTAARPKLLRSIQIFCSSQLGMQLSFDKCQPIDIKNFKVNWLQSELVQSIKGTDIVLGSARSIFSYEGTAALIRARSKKLSDKNILQFPKCHRRKFHEEMMFDISGLHLGLLLCYIVYKTP